MMRDLAGWGQVVVGVLSVVLSLGIGWVAMSKTQAETQVKIVKIEERVEKGEDYDAFLQAQLDSAKERIIITETTVAFLKENSEEMNENLKVLVSEMKQLNTKMAVLAAKGEK